MILLLTFGVTGRQGHLMNYQLEKTFILKGIRPTRIPFKVNLGTRYGVKPISE